MKRIMLILLGLFVLYVAYLYITDKRETYLIPKDYEGVLLIIGNQEDGVEINKNNAVYDFTKSNIIKLKGNLITGFSPWGYLNYYEVDKNGNKNKISEIDEDVETANTKDNKIYIWSYYFAIGGCEVRNNGTTYYQALVVSKKINVKAIAMEKQQLINQEVCYKKIAQ